MLKIQNLAVKLVENNKIVIRDINLDIEPGSVHLLVGNNGSGKSSFVNTLMSHPAFEITNGSIKLINEEYDRFVIEKITQDAILESKFLSKDLINVEIDITNLSPDEKSRLGLFLANQYPTEIPGVPMMQFLRLIYNINKPKHKQLPVFKFKELLSKKIELLKYNKDLLTRNLNEGFSGGEKKKTEILQMLVLEPRYIFLDEIDSGLDKKSTHDVFSLLGKYKELYPKSAFIIITHYEKIYDYIEIDYVHEIENGIIISSKK